ncbi:putative cytochrome P450 oxidoreductase/alkane hydroxylase [Periconia macrospinosa]|uniref:Putative cytochrome P450 oxidoreductase/alkane hydroxylase n=1 Tax=Periconia macrospinosa TaxID=97972 RepID=A0A2V1D5N8_9PLEO|nr:putative cytochrome P450 oxidoreductase/alkane hydroxylase [Periconia macrospinosa]
MQHLKNVAATHSCQPPTYEKPYFPINIHKAWAIVRQYQAQNVLSYFLNLFKVYGDTFVSRVLWLDIVVTCEPENIKQILQRRFDDFDIAPLRRHLFLPITPHGIFNCDGAEWIVVRKIFRTQFADTRAIVDLNMMEDHFQRMLERIPQDGQAVDLQNIFIRLITDVLGTIAVGEPLGSLSMDQKPETIAIEEALRHVKERIAQFGQTGPAHWLYNREKFRLASNLIREYIERFVRQAVQGSHDELASEDSARKRGVSFVQGAAYQTSDFASLRDQTTSIYLAGIDSVAGLLSSTFWFLSRDRRIFSKLKEDVLDNVGHDRPSYDQLSNSIYLRYVLNEAMRIMPGVPFNAKVANKDTWLPRGGGPDGTASILVKKGQIVSFWSWASHRNASIFGDDVEEFRPERWETIKGNVSGYIPFQPGPRVCPGQRIALAIASYFVIRLLQTFGSIENRDSKVWKEKLGLALSIENGVIVALS